MEVGQDRFRRALALAFANAKRVFGSLQSLSEVCGDILLVAPIVTTPVTTPTALAWVVGHDARSHCRKALLAR